MPLGLHHNWTAGQVHQIFYWWPADATALAAITPTSADNGKCAWQLDSNKFWVLTDYSVPTWRQFGGGVSDHGALSGLSDDDHTQYLLATGLREWSEQGSDPSTPAANKWKLYFKAGGLYLIDDAAAVTGPLGTSGVTDHGALTGLGDDDHTIYALLAGRSGGQTLKGSTSSGETLTLASTNHATKGGVRLGDGDWLRVQEISAPATPATGYVAVYAKTDGKLYIKDDAGTETDLTAAGGSGGSLTLARWTALDGQPPASNYATLDSRNSIMVLDFDATTDESIVFVGIVPEGAVLTGGVAIYIHWMATSATSGSVTWEASIERMNTDEDTDSFSTVAFATSATNGTSGIITKTTISQSAIDSMVAGDAFRLKISRDANGTNGTDDMTGDAELVAVELRGVA